MLNIFLIKSKKNDELFDNKQTSLVNEISLNKDVSCSPVASKETRPPRGETRHYLPATKEWLNSIYTYNVNYMKSLAITDNVVNKIIKSYFFLRLVYMKNIFKGKSKRQRLLSVNRIFVSKPEMKHTNNKVIITLYTYNKEKNYFIRKLISLRHMLIFRNNCLFLINLKKKAILKNIYKVSFLIYNILKKKDLLKNYENNKQVFEDLISGAIASQRSLFPLPSLPEREAPAVQRRPGLRGNGDPLYQGAVPGELVKGEKQEKLFEKFNDTIQWKTFEKQFFSTKKEFTGNPVIVNILQSYVKELYIYYLRKSLAVMSRKEMLYLYYNQMLSLNIYKFNKSFISNKGLGLVSLISKIYNKKVEFNIVDLKSSHLNSDIFSDSISTKLNDRKKRVLRVLKKALSLVRLMPSPLSLRLKNISNSVYTGDNVEKIGLSFIKNKAINGVRLEASGRLTRRLTASRSISKKRYVGNLRNIASYDNEISSVMLRGHVKSNIQYTNINSKTRNGAYGLKVWVSSY